MDKIYIKIQEIAHKFAAIPGLKSLLKPVYYPIKRAIKSNRNRTFKKNGLAVLSDFDKCLIENGYKYTLAFGTLLGAVREHGFIKHDLDIDTSMWIDDYDENLASCLKESGFKLDHEFLVGDGALGREQTYSKNGVSIDVFYFYPPIDEYPYCCDFLAVHGASTIRESMAKYGEVVARRIELPLSQDVKRIPFESLELFIPDNADEILRFRYGADYMVPNPDWTIGSYDAHIKVWTEEKGKYQEYNS